MDRGFKSSPADVDPHDRRGRPHHEQELETFTEALEALAEALEALAETLETLPEALRGGSKVLLAVARPTGYLAFTLDPKPRGG